MPYTPEELLTLKEIRTKNKQRYQKWYYENKTKVNRNLAKQGLSIHNGTVFKHEYLNGGEITVKDVSNKPLSPQTLSNK